jgi:hypothetical protein
MWKSTWGPAVNSVLVRGRSAWAGLAGRGHWLARGAAALARRWDWIVQPVLVFAVTRVVVFAAGVVGDLYLPTEEGHWVADPNSQFLSLWAKWDSQWYVQVARGGYLYQPLQQSNVAFFPLFPLLMRLAAPLAGGNLVLAGFLVSNGAFLLALVFLYRLAEFEVRGFAGATPLDARGASRRTLWYLALFPTAFFFSAVYTESLFLLLSVAAIYCARRRWWVAAAAAGLLAAATRNLGVLLWALVLWEWMRAQGWRLVRIHRRDNWWALWAGIKRNWLEVVIVGVIPLGLLLYAAFLQVNFARPTAFVEVQAAWNRRNIGPVAVVLREINALADFTLNRSNLSRLMNLGALLGALAVVPAVWRRLGEGYAIYVLILLLVPASSALQSMIRYALPLFPVFIVLGWWGRRPTVDRTLLAAFGVLLGVLTTIFANWYFVA